MTRLAHNLQGAVGALLLTALVTASSLLDDLTLRTGLSATLILLVCIGLLLLAALAVLAWMAVHEVNDSETYRTASKAQLTADITKARRTVPHATPNKANFVMTSGCKDFLPNTSRRFTVVPRAGDQPTAPVHTRAQKGG